MLDTPVFASAAVAAPHRLASEAGRAVLAEGGNAIEAMVAMAATIAVVYPHMNAIGGDGFWRWHPALPPLKDVVMRRSGATADWRICMASGCRPMGDYLPADADPVTLKICD